MTEAEAMQDLIDRYDCEIRQTPWGVHADYKDVHLLISFDEKLQMWGNGTIWIKSNVEWSTGEFAVIRKYKTKELINVLDRYLPIRMEEQLKLL